MFWRAFSADNVNFILFILIFQKKKKKKKKNKLDKGNEIFSTLVPNHSTHLRLGFGVRVSNVT